MWDETGRLAAVAERVDAGADALRWLATELAERTASAVWSGSAADAARPVVAERVGDLDAAADRLHEVAARLRALSEPVDAAVRRLERAAGVAMATTKGTADAALDGLRALEP
jgi:ABC-type transporter Mla subunit MlaD